jgi:hypothetical protein
MMVSGSEAFARGVMGPDALAVGGNVILVAVAHRHRSEQRMYFANLELAPSLSTAFALGSDHGAESSGS